MPGVLATATWPPAATGRRRRSGSLGPQHDRFGGGGEHPAHRVEEAAGFLEREREAAEGLGEADEHEVAERVAVELAAR